MTMTPERIAELRGEISSCHNLREPECREMLGEIERLQAKVTIMEADKQRLAAEIYRLNETIAKAKAAFDNPGEAYSDEKTAVRMWEVLEGK
jgi:hypothetical protein